MVGKLFVVATPIGNLGDITLRAIETLKEVDRVLCEDTRHTQKLMNHLKISKPLSRYDEYTHHRSAPAVLEELKRGKRLALVSDAGTPAISDPGSRLVQLVLEEGLEVVPIPGPSSLLAALSVLGEAGEGHLFLGFLPRKRGKAKRILREAFGLGRTVVVFESPHRVQATLELAGEIAPEMRAIVAREMTKIHEEYVRGTIEQILIRMKTRPPKGEVVLLFKKND